MTFNTNGNQRLYPDDFRSAQAAETHFLNDFSMRALQAGQKLYSLGKHAHAAMAFKYGLAHDPSEARLHIMLIVAYKGLEKKVEMERQFRILGKILRTEEDIRSVQDTLENWNYIPNSGEDLPWTSRNEPPFLTNSLFGTDGAFGNQIFQYAFPKLYAEKYGLQYEINDWSGRKLFGLQDPAISRILPFIIEIEYLRDDVFALPPLELGLCDRDSQGYFQFHTAAYRPFKEKFIGFFQPTSMVKWAMQPFMQEIRCKGKTLVAVHLRLKDAATQNRAASLPIYINWLKEIWPTLDAPILFLASDDLDAVRQEFQPFSPFTSEMLRFPISEANYYPDFFVMTQADILAAGNSTFSFAASMLNQTAKLFVRPDVGNTKLLPYDPWDSHPTV